MRARNLKPSLFKNEELADLGPYAVVLFEGLWCLADRKGRLYDRPRRIKAEVMPYWDIDIEDLLEQLVEAGFITRYFHREDQYIEVVNFTKHQHPHYREAESTLPGPDSEGASPGKARGKPGASTGKGTAEPSSSPSDSGLLTPDIKSEVGTSDPVYLELATELSDWIQTNNPKAKRPTTKRLEQWANDMRLMVERDGHSIDEIRRVMNWSQQHPTQPSGFSWRNNILSAGKLREKFAELWGHMQSESQRTKAPTNGVLPPKYKTVDEIRQDREAEARKHPP